MRYRVLSVDGGGSGILPARVLAELETLSGRPIADQFDLIAGTGSGAILALALARCDPRHAPRYTAQQLLGLFLAKGEGLFPPPTGPRRLRRFVGLPPRAAPASLTRLLDELFGATPFGEARSDVMTPTVDLAAGTPLLLRSGEFTGLGAPLMSQVAMASLSVPGFFAPVEIELGSRAFRLAHGGVVANNPTLFAYTAALRQADPPEVLIVSLGAGSPGIAGTLSTPRHGGRASDWGSGALASQIDTAGETQHRILESLLAATGSRSGYWRIQAPLELGVPGPHAKAGRPISELAGIAEALVEAHRPQLRAATKALA